VAQGANRAAPLVAETKRMAGARLTEALGVSVEQRYISTANSDERHVDNHLAAGRCWQRDILHTANTGTCDQKSSHCAASSGHRDVATIC
jgi:hypothetical protein